MTAANAVAKPLDKARPMRTAVECLGQRSDHNGRFWTMRPLLWIRCSCWSPCGPDDPCVIWRGLGLHHPAERPRFDFLLQPDRRVLVTRCEPVPEPDTGEPLMAEQGGHALPPAAAGDDYLGVVADPFDEGQALRGRFRRPIWPRKDPAVAE